MVRLAISLVIVCVICGAMCYMTNKICKTVDNNKIILSAEHSVLMKDHEDMMKAMLSTRMIANENSKVLSENNKMLRFIYDMAKGIDNKDR